LGFKGTSPLLIGFLVAILLFQTVSFGTIPTASAVPTTIGNCESPFENSPSSKDGVGISFSKPEYTIHDQINLVISGINYDRFEKQKMNFTFKIANCDGDIVVEKDTIGLHYFPIGYGFAANGFNSGKIFAQLEYSIPKCYGAKCNTTNYEEGIKGILTTETSVFSPTTSISNLWWDQDDRGELDLIIIPTNQDFLFPISMFDCQECPTMGLNYFEPYESQVLYMPVILKPTSQFQIFIDDEYEDESEFGKIMKSIGGFFIDAVADFATGGLYSIATTVIGVATGDSSSFGAAVKNASKDDDLILGYAYSDYKKIIHPIMAYQEDDGQFKSFPIKVSDISSSSSDKIHVFYSHKARTAVATITVGSIDSYEPKVPEDEFDQHHEKCKDRSSRAYIYECIFASYELAKYDQYINDPNRDTDEDRISDSVDNCPINANPYQQDADGDGMGDACDSDADNDGILNKSDNCPYVPNPDQNNKDLDAYGDVCDTRVDSIEVYDPSKLDIDASEFQKNYTAAKTKDSDGDGIPDSSAPVLRPKQTSIEFLKKMQRINPDEIRKLTEPEIKRIDPRIMNEMSPKVWSGFKAKQIDILPKESIESLQPKLFKNLPSKEIASLSPETVKQLPMDTKKILSPNLDKMRMAQKARSTILQQGIPGLEQVPIDISPKVFSRPLAQLSEGVAPEDIVCNEGFELLQKTFDKSPICVKPSTAEKLIALGVAHQIS